MQSSGEPRKPAGPPKSVRPAPERPAYTSVPRTFRSDPVPPPRTLDFVTGVWGLSFLALVVTIIAGALYQSSVRSAIQTSLAAQNPGVSVDTISKTVLYTVVGCGAIAVLLALGEAYLLMQLRYGRPQTRWMLVVVGIVNICGLLLAWRLLSDAGSVAGGIVHWGPIAQAAVIVVALLALFLPPISRWLRGAEDEQEKVAAR